jgi:hypothetical protein
LVDGYGYAEAEYRSGVPQCFASSSDDLTHFRPVPVLTHALPPVNPTGHCAPPPGHSLTPARPPANPTADSPDQPGPSADQAPPRANGRAFDQPTLTASQPHSLTPDDLSPFQTVPASTHAFPPVNPTAHSPTLPGHSGPPARPRVNAGVSDQPTLTASQPYGPAQPGPFRRPGPSPRKRRRSRPANPYSLTASQPYSPAQPGPLRRPGPSPRKCRRSRPANP